MKELRKSLNSTVLKKSFEKLPHIVFVFTFVLEKNKAYWCMFLIQEKEELRTVWKQKEDKSRLNTFWKFSGRA